MRVGYLSIFLLLSFLSSVFGIRDESNQERWEKPVGHGPDSLVPGFLVNLGPTGARAILKSKTFVVKYIFKGSPAEGKLKLNDIITGVNGKEFSAHTFGSDKTLGIEGPIYDMGLAIEESEGSDGTLSLSVNRGGSTLTVKIQLEQLGTFSSSFPENCEKAKLLHKRALDYFARDNSKMGIDGRCAAILALISSDDKKHQEAGNRMIQGLNRVAGTGTWSWDLAFRCIALAEYYILTQDNSVLETLKGNLDLLRRAQYKGSNIQIWKAKEGESQEKLDEHQQLYEGGFGHKPFDNGFGKNGYGPMQSPTILAVIAWQLGKECGIEVKHEGIQKALQFMNYGTNSGGNVAYGGEFTLAFGFRDPVKFKNSTKRGNPQKSGLSILAYNLTPEYDKSESYLKLHKENMHETFKGMANGHADGIMAMTWGMLGAGASNDEKLKRKVFNYFKIWLNMSRCHGSESYVALPGRDYADGAYYRDNRSHVTALAALIYSFFNPKLQVHGVRVAIPGVNHKNLTPALAQAYQLILEGKFGVAAKVIIKEGVTSGGDAEKMLAFLNSKIKNPLAEIEKNLTSGHWHEVSDSFGKLSTYWDGVPHFDDRYNYFKSLLVDQGGKLLLQADRLYHDEQYGKSMQLVKAAHEKTTIDEIKKYSAAIKEDISKLSAKYTMDLKYMEVRGEWYTLLQHLKKIPETYGGIEEVDTLAVKLMEPYKEPSGKALALAHKSMVEGNYSNAYKIAIQISTKFDNKRHIKIADVQKKKIEEMVDLKVSELEKVKQSGRWATLYRQLVSSSKTHAGVSSYNDFYNNNMGLIKSSVGRVLVSSEKLLENGNYSLIAKSLQQVAANEKTDTDVKDIAAKILSQIESNVKPRIDELKRLEGEEDWFAVKNELHSLNRDLSGIESFDSEKERLNKKFLEPEINKLINAGKEFYELQKKWNSRQSKGLRRKIETFVKENEKNIYGEKAKDLIGS